ncbi:MAG: tetratricopeptide repeat protein [Proteobacteria bacterium]|nr:tetratricopeptide repeat protein [Pseudomonadota bacterium]
MNSSNPKYWAFISYSHRDTRWASWLHRALESYHPPKQIVGTVTARGAVPRKLSPVFRDREELATSTTLGDSLNAALAGSRCQIVICSPSAARSRWVNEEILAFKRLGRSDRIFCFIVDGEPNASDDPAQAQQECFPPALRFELDPDGSLSSRRTEPIAADARPGKDGRGNAKLKLIAGILGVGFDALRQRELHRRQRRLFAIASAAVAGMVLTTGLATAALIARSQAKHQTVIARREAETARQTTEFLVDLFRISDPTEARGNSLTAREVLDSGAARVGRQLTHQPQVQATLMDTLGTVYLGLGLYRQAQPLLEAAAQKRQSLRPAQPAEVALSLSHLADLRSFRADYPGAEQAYRRAIALQRALPAAQRDVPALARTLYGLANELENRGEFQEAERTLRETLTLQEEAFQGANEDTARTLALLAWTVQQRNLNEAIPLMERATGMQRTLWGTTPYPDYAHALNDLGLMYRDRGDYERSETLLRESLAMERRLVGDKHPDLALMLDNLGVVQERRGNPAAAATTFRQALDMQRELLGETHPDVANTVDLLASTLYESGDVSAALETEQEALAIYRKLFTGDNPDVARLLNRLGYWLTEAGRYQAADLDLQEALKMRQRLFGPHHPEIASSLVHVGILQVATGKYSDAQASARGAAGIFGRTLSADNWKTAVADSIEGAALCGMGQYSEAEEHLIRSYGIISQDAGAMQYRDLTRGYLKTLYQRWGRPREAQRYTAATRSPPFTHPGH